MSILLPTSNPVKWEAELHFHQGESIVSLRSAATSLLDVDKVEIAHKR